MATESMTRVSTRVLGEQSRRGVRYWGPPLVGAAIYPELLDSFARAVDNYHSSGNLLHAADAALLMLLAGSVTLLAARALIRMRQDEAGRVRLRGLLYLMFSTPPLLILFGEVAWLVGVKGPAVVSIWTVGWMVAAVALYFRKEDAPPKRPSVAIVWIRVVHGAVALCLLCAFLLGHLLNHDMALWSVKLHGQVMEWLRHWYRSAWVEPGLLVLLGVMIATGFPLVASHSRQRADSFRILQMATGVYLGAFICAHVFAVLAARRGGIETDWFFGVGPHGLLDGRGALIAYYIYSACFLFLHAGFGLRIVLLKHGTQEPVANRAVYGVATVGFVITILLTVAAFGFHLRP